MKTPHIVGNWKMNHDSKQVKEFFDSLTKEVSDYATEKWIAPQFIHIQEAIREASLYNIKIGAQNAAVADAGAFTGEVSPKALKELGVHFVILGHSERRQIFKETDEIINNKIRACLKNDLKVILCVGETLDERENNKTQTVVLDQLKKSLNGILLNPENILIAYEPIWAIGTGKAATPEDAEAVHKIIREYLHTLDVSKGEETLLLYGGSVKPENIQALLGEQNIDGALVGGASLNSEDFVGLSKALF